MQDGPLRMSQFARFRFVVDGFGLLEESRRELPMAREMRRNGCVQVTGRIQDFRNRLSKAIFQPRHSHQPSAEGCTSNSAPRPVLNSATIGSGVSTVTTLVVIG